MDFEQNVSLKDKNWFKTGGSAQVFCKPTSGDEFKKSLIYAQEHTLDTFVIGQGANILISDAGFPGLVIAPAINDTYCKFSDSTVTFGAGLTIQEAIDWSLDNNFIGLEEFSGIPGTIGGATYMNTHYFNTSFSDFLISAEVIKKQSLEIQTVDASWFNFGYDQSKLQEKEWFLIRATCKLHLGSRDESLYAKGRRDEIIRHRNARYPHNNTCGSFFRNLHPSDVQHLPQKLTYAAYYLEKLGIKGELSHGDASVSYQHANMLVNRGNATSNDIIALARTIQTMVRERFDILLQPECQFVGFDEYPLLQTTPRPAKSTCDTAPSVGP